MDTHHELSGYIHCDDTARIAQALRRHLEAEGMVCVESATGLVPDVASVDCNIWRVAVLPGRMGWHLLLAAPDALLCETGSDGKIRFAALSDALGAPGFVHEAWDMEDYCGPIGNVQLHADGQGRHVLAGELRDYGNEDEWEGDRGQAKWRGHDFKRGEVSADDDLWPAISARFPTEPEKDPERYEPNLDGAGLGLWYVEHLAGRALGDYWRDEAEAWQLLTDHVAHGEAVPVAGAITLTFQWPARDRTWPKPAASAASPRPPFLYAGDDEIRIGDRVRLSDGSEGEVVNLLATIRRDFTAPRYIAVQVDGHCRMIELTYVKRDQRRMLDAVCIGAAEPPGAKPDVQELEQRAGAGDVGAMVQLGFLYYLGDGQPPNPPASAKWLTAAAKARHPDACYRLAQHHREEFGVRFSPAKIRALAEAAYRHGSVEAADTLIDYGVGPLLERISGLAGEGNPIAQYQLAQRMLEGKDVPQDHQEAARLFELAAAQGHEMAQFEAGRCYDEGIGVAANAARAAHWYGQAVYRGCNWAYPPLARLYAQGRGVDKDMEKARDMLEYARREGIPGADEALSALQFG